MTRCKGGINTEPRVKNTVDVAVSMHPNFLTRLNAHLDELGESNRSGWIRGAIVSKMNRESEALREPEEKVY